MKLVSAIIRPQELDPARRALAAFGSPGLTVTATSVATRWNRRLEIYRSTVLVADLAQRLRVDVLAADEDAADLAAVLARVAAAAAVRGGGDDTVGVWITPVEQAVRVRTGERGAGAV
ncbi:MAG TPA: P-II family nitrogen regulator [Actinocrinis sp.]